LPARQVALEAERDLGLDAEQRHFRRLDPRAAVEHARSHDRAVDA
jgi:hypothetical protein